MNEGSLCSENVWGAASAQDALRQVADLCHMALGIDMLIPPESTSFIAKKSPEGSSGILSASGALVNDSVIEVQLELFRSPGDIRIPLALFARQLAALGEKSRLLPPREDGDELGLFVEIKALAQPMSPARAAVFIEELTRLNEVAKSIQAELPRSLPPLNLEKIYQGCNDILLPVYPVTAPDDLPEGLAAWGDELLDFLSASASVAMVSPFPVATEFGLAVLAGRLAAKGKSVGQLLLPVVPAKGVPEIIAKAPGFVAIPAVRLSIGTSPYEMGNEIQALLTTQTAVSRPVIFTGTREELQGVFHGGQGGGSDPLCPVVMHLPEIPAAILVRYAIASCARTQGGISRKDETELADRIDSALAKSGKGEKRRIIPYIVKREMAALLAGGNPKSTEFADKICGLAETFSGLGRHPRFARRAEVQERLVRTLTDPALLDHLKSQLLAQDEALERLCGRLAMEVLTRPLHQPLRYAAQGTPGTGKSESAVLLAERLGIPYVNIDAASMPDYHTAASQLLGSGRGIVMSHQPGRLEQVAKHHTGALVEISDLDHAPPSVRSGLADLFLQVMETGEAQSATGAMFSCANLIFAFTMNLPDGMDETVRKGMGFTGDLSRRDVEKRVVTEIKRMISGAFLSRVGTPILFDPLGGAALGELMERATIAAIRSASGRLQIDLGSIVVESGLGTRIIAALGSGFVSFGARALLEQGRSLAAAAIINFCRQEPIPGKNIRVTLMDGGRLGIEIIQKGD